MSTEEIVFKWLSIDANREKLPKVKYSAPIYDFIRATASTYSFFGATNPIVYLINGQYQIIISE